MTLPLYGAIEAGGTKFICAVAREPQQLLAHKRIATSTPAATLQATLEFFAEQEQLHGTLAGIGIASFGPLGLHKRSGHYGHILATPKPGWSYTDMVSPFLQRFDCPVAIDTDVNAAALAESQLGAGRDCSPVVYVTVGTGIGGGIAVNGRCLQGALHPEMGHIRVARHPQDNEFRGVCPFHNDCLEGLASGVAMQARYATSITELPPPWQEQALTFLGFYLGQLASNVILVLSPQKLVLGGGLLQLPGLLEQVRRNTAQLLNAYAGIGAPAAALEQLIVAPGLGPDSGILGALLLAPGFR